MLSQQPPRPRICQLIFVIAAVRVCFPVGTDATTWATGRCETLQKRGRPPTTGKGVQVGERWHTDELATIDAWIEDHGETMTRGQAIRRLVEIGLKARRDR